MEIQNDPLIHTQAGHLLTSTSVLYPIQDKQFSRLYVVPNYPSSGQQQTWQTVRAGISAAFANATPAQFAAWDLWRKTFTRSWRAPGIFRPLSRRSAFFRINFARFIASEEWSTTAPTTPPPLTPSQIAWYNWAGGGPNGFLTYVWHPITPVTNYRIALRITPKFVPTTIEGDRRKLRFYRGISIYSSNNLAASGAAIGWPLGPLNYPSGSVALIELTITNPEGVPSRKWQVRATKLS